MRGRVHRATAALGFAVAIAGSAHAAEIKMAGKLNVPADANVVAICTDPVVQNVLNEDLRAARHGQPSASDHHLRGVGCPSGEVRSATVRIALSPSILSPPA